MADVLSEDAVADGLKGSVWKQDSVAIHRDFTLADFREALAFVNRVGEVAEAVNHHPDILIHDWNKVRLTLTTHSAGGVTQSDLDMAREIDRIG